MGARTILEIAAVAVATTIRGWAEELAEEVAARRSLYRFPSTPRSRERDDSLSGICARAASIVSEKQGREDSEGCVAHAAADSRVSGHERLVAFSCKRRGFCPSCVGRRM